MTPEEWDNLRKRIEAWEVWREQRAADAGTPCDGGTTCFNRSCAQLGCLLDRQRESDKHTAANPNQ